MNYTIWTVTANEKTIKIPVLDFVQQSRKTTKDINQKKLLYKDVFLRAGILLTVHKGKLQFI